MQSDLIRTLIDFRMLERKVKKAYPDYEQLTLKAYETLTIKAPNAIWFLVDSPSQVQIESDTGSYGFSSHNKHEFEGTFKITNTDSNPTKVSFVVLLIQE